MVRISYDICENKYGWCIMPHYYYYYYFICCFLEKKTRWTLLTHMCVEYIPVDHIVYVIATTNVRKKKKTRIRSLCPWLLLSIYYCSIFIQKASEGHMETHMCVSVTSHLFSFAPVTRPICLDIMCTISEQLNDHLLFTFVLPNKYISHGLWCQSKNRKKKMANYPSIEIYETFIPTVRMYYVSMCNVPQQRSKSLWAE